jgi:hypothetical protein
MEPEAQWGIYLTVSDFSEVILYTSEAQSIDIHSHIWTPLQLKNNGTTSYEAQRFSLNIELNVKLQKNSVIEEGNIHVFKQRIDMEERHSTKLGNLRYNISNMFRLKVTYEEIWYGEGRPSNYSITKIKLTQCEHFNMHDYIKSEMHKVICSIQIMNRDQNSRRMEKHTSYLGRAQQITTLSGDRDYVWLQNLETDAFPGIKTNESWDSHVKEHHDMLQMRTSSHALLSARDLKHDLAYIPDNDDFKNEKKILPIFIDIEQEETMIIKFSNLPQNQYAELTLRHTDFHLRQSKVKDEIPVSVNKRFSWTQKKAVVIKRHSSSIESYTLKKIINDNLCVEITYCSKNKKNRNIIAVICIKLKVKNYKQSLTNFGDYQSRTL